MDPVSLSDRLRRDTLADHEATEAAFDLGSWLSSREAYRALLERLLDIHETAEAALPGGSSRAALIRRDITALGGVPRPVHLPAIAGVAKTPAGALGLAYVLEGSSLGGLLIAREAETRLGLGDANGASFFAGDGRATMANWRNWKAEFDGRGAEADADAVVMAARAAFAAVAAVLERPRARDAA